MAEVAKAVINSTVNTSRSLYRVFGSSFTEHPGTGAATGSSARGGARYLEGATALGTDKRYSDDTGTPGATWGG